MAHRILEHPVRADRVTILVTSEESAGDLFRFEYLAGSVTPPPPDHVHADQDERLEVIEGTLRCRVAGVEHQLGAGESVVIPRGVPHTVWNDNPAGSRSLGEYRPALDAQAMFELEFGTA